MKLGDRDGGHREIMSLQPEGRHPDHHGDRQAHDDAAGNSDQRRHLPVGEHQQRRIGADAEEHRMADRDLARVAADDVPGRRPDRGEQQVRAHALVERAAQHQRIGQQRQRDETEAEAHQAIFPRRP